MGQAGWGKLAVGEGRGKSMFEPRDNGRQKEGAEGGEGGGGDRGKDF